jgi:hypothetical protein
LIPPKLPKAYAKAQKSINGLIDSYVLDLQQLKVRYNEHIGRHVGSYHMFEQLRLKLLTGEPLNAGEATGDAVAKMLKEIKEMGNIANPYCLSGAEVEQRMADIRQSMAEIRKSIETLWTTVAFRDCTLAISDLNVAYSATTIVNFVNCRSKEWAEIGKRLTTLPKLSTLTVEHCDSGHNLCTGINSSKSLTSLCMSNECATQTTVSSPTKESNNCTKCNSWQNCVSVLPRRRLKAITTLSQSTDSQQYSKHSKRCLS